ncbi:hypothetical protein GWK47_039002 [Chionoecetes opilio]|uniref:Uncharacterized protein n=1 Tax=Chionoecetes opilio TaxID=41210 RepID=A0A8J5D1J7_CHIOP|nr:hypothetical protein GWK47_039002 [Chionoecetes opilio]
MVCPSSSLQKFRQTIQGTGILQIGPSCAVHADTFTLPALDEVVDDAPLSVHPSPLPLAPLLAGWEKRVLTQLPNDLPPTYGGVPPNRAVCPGTKTPSYPPGGGATDGVPVCCLVGMGLGGRGSPYRHGTDGWCLVDGPALCSSPLVGHFSRCPIFLVEHGGPPVSPRYGAPSEYDAGTRHLKREGLS